MAKPKKSIKLSFQPVFVGGLKRKFRYTGTPTTRKSNVGVIGHPSVKSNVGLIRARIKRKK